MIGVTGYLCLDLYPELGDAPFTFVPGMLREIGAVPGHPGGAIGNTGGALCRLGMAPRLGCVVGDDVFGSALQTEMKKIAAGADLRLRVVPGQPSGCAIVLNPVDSDRMFLACRGVNDRVTAADFGPEFRQGLELLHFGYPPLCQSMALQDGAELLKLYQACHQEGIITSLDMSLPSPQTFSYGLDWRKFLQNVLPETDVFCPSIDELKFMLQSAPEATPEELAEVVLAWGAKVVFIKMGSQGAYLRTADSDAVDGLFRRFGEGAWRRLECAVPVCPVKVVGTTGAGDAAIAGFLTGIVQGFGGADAAKLAMRVAACSVSAVDSLSGIPTYQEIIAKGDWK